MSWHPNCYFVGRLQLFKYHMPTQTKPTYFYYFFLVSHQHHAAINRLPQARSLFEGFKDATITVFFVE
jgi:hypothetical protein